MFVCTRVMSIGNLYENNATSGRGAMPRSKLRRRYFRAREYVDSPELRFGGWERETHQCKFGCSIWQPLSLSEPPWVSDWAACIRRRVLTLKRHKYEKRVTVEPLEHYRNAPWLRPAALLLFCILSFESYRRARSSYNFEPIVRVSGGK